MKKFFTFLIVITISSCFFACSDSSDKGYRSDISVNDLASEIIYKLPDHEQYARYGKEDLLLSHGEELSECDAAVFVTKNPSSINEFGIFYAPDRLDETLDELKDYLYDTVEGKTEWLRSYNPSELSKLNDGRVRVFGNYAVYSFLDADSRDLLYSEIEKTLKKD